jgi:hypothetical protein
MRPIIVAFTVLFATSLGAATISVEPAAPTSATPVTLKVGEWVSCPPPPEITRSGNRFTVLINPGVCLTPPVFGTFTIPLGLLAPGDYEVVSGAPERNGYAAFYVREADARVSVLGSSVGPITGGTEVMLFAPEAYFCYSTDLQQCPVPTVTFNGVAADASRPRVPLLRSE